MDHSKQSGFQPKISTSSNFQNNHRVSQVIEPVVNTITDAIKKGFTDYNSHKQYGNTACQVLKKRIQNLLDFWPKINILKGNYCILSIDIVARWEKLQKSNFESQFSPSIMI